MKLWVGVTDQGWFDFLSCRPDLDEVNFWQPGGRQLFKALSPGEPFLFKLKFPTNVIAGGAFFAHASILPISLAWETFEEKNGAASLGKMFELIAPLKPKGERLTVGDPIGCIILRDPFFWPREQWIPAPTSFKKQIVSGRPYDLTLGDGALLWRQIQERLRARQLPRVAEPPGPTYGGFTTVPAPLRCPSPFRRGIRDGHARLHLQSERGPEGQIPRRKDLPTLQFRADLGSPRRACPTGPRASGVAQRGGVPTMSGDRLDTVHARLRAFVAEREWERFHDPKNLAMAIASEAGELLAEYRWVANTAADEWSRDPANRQRVTAEAADVGIALVLFCNRVGLDLIEVMHAKIEVNAKLSTANTGASPIHPVTPIVLSVIDLQT